MERPNSSPLVIAVRAKGSDARDVRDAAHEACHALRWGVKKAWTRDNIHAKKPKARALGVSEEIMARAVEQIVSAELKFDCGDVKKWAFTCWMEMMKNERITLPTDGWLEKAIRDCMESSAAATTSGLVLALVTT